MRTEEAASQMSAQGVYAISVAAAMAGTGLHRSSVLLGHILDAVSRAGEP
ncbi:MAG TPA: hypothetical protein VIT41_09245 [Microlunatus sp.]